MNFIEDGQIAGTRKSEDGYLVAAVKCARTGIQMYRGVELGKPELDWVRVYRPEEEVFSKRSLATFVGKPCTDNHPPFAVNSENWKDYAVGTIHEGALREGEFVRVPVTLMDAGVVAQVESGKREISMGYTMDLHWEAGKTPSGEAYDAVQRNIRINHLAIVDKGRAGSECRVGDGDTWAEAPSPKPNEPTKPMSQELKTVTVDGLPVETTAAGAQAIAKITADKAAVEKQLADAKTEHAEAIAAKDKELAAKDAEIDKLQKAQIGDAELDKRVSERAKLIGDASKLAKDADFTGMSDADIRRTAVEAIRGKDAIEGKSESYIAAAFDLAVEAANDSQGGDQSFRKAVESRQTATDEDNGQSAYEKRLADAWKTSPAA